MALPAFATDALAASAGKYPAHPKWRFVFVNHVTTNPFFVPTRYGAEDACTMTNTTYQWTGSETAKTPEMINAMNAAISGKADGIAVCVVDPKAFDAPPRRRSRPASRSSPTTPTARPPTSGSPTSARISSTPASRWASASPRWCPKGGRIGLFIATPGQSNIQPRIDGAQSALKGKGYKIDVITTGADVPGELSKIDAYYQGHKDVKGLFAVDAGSTQGIAPDDEEARPREGRA